MQFCRLPRQDLDGLIFEVGRPVGAAPVMRRCRVWSQREARHTEASDHLQAKSLSVYPSQDGAEARIARR